jgi:hypothetical protein
MLVDFVKPGNKAVLSEVSSRNDTQIKAKGWVFQRAVIKEKGRPTGSLFL